MKVTSASAIIDHACYGCELNNSRIAKLWLQRLEDKLEVFNWDRGMDKTAKTPTAQAIVDFLCERLADLVYA